MADVQAQKDEKDPSVEEILQSIRRIIAEDGDEAQPAAPAIATAPAREAEPVVTGSDVLELTDIVKDDGTVVNIKTRMPEPALSTPMPAMDVLSNIDQALLLHEKKAPVISPVSARSAPVIPATAVTPTAVVTPVAMPPAAAPATAAPAMKALDMPPVAPLAASSMKKPVASSLVSEQAVFASAETFRNFAEAATRESVSAKEKEKPMDAPAFRTGVTVEDLVKETLRPLLKEWLDKNLPTMVQKVVEKEIRRIANSAIQD